MLLVHHRTTDEGTGRVFVNLTVGFGTLDND